MPRTAAAPARDDALEALLGLVREWRLLLGVPLAVGVLTLAGTFAITPTFSARTSFLPPPPQQQTGAVAALASLGGAGGLGGLASGLAQRTPADQYVALAMSVTVADRLLEKYKLLEVYDKDWRQDARKKLWSNTRAMIGRRDGVIVIEVDDDDPQRAADMANSYVDELRALTQRLALTEAQQRRIFFEGHLERTRDALVKAQLDLQSSGFSQDALKAEPKAAAEGYAKLKAEVTMQEARLQTLRRALTEDAPEVRQLGAALGVLRGQLARIEDSATQGASSDYVGKYRAYKYQEVLFEQFARQYELARIDESREGLLQVVDRAQPPERKSWPPRGLLTLAGVALGFIGTLAWLLALRRRAA
jgi:uncharacterized protein involved in exopolysaccharide biosynthesis